MLSTVNILVQFVEGHMETRLFEDALYNDPDIEKLLSAELAPQYALAAHTLYHYLITLNYRNPIDMLNAESVIVKYLKEQQGINMQVSSDRADMVKLIAVVQPKWLELDPSYVQQLMQEAPEKLSKNELKKWLQCRILELFRYAKKPPKWLQAPAWPMGEKKPLVFLGQITIPDYFHDEAAAYVFHDPVTQQCQTIVQVY
ncbi:hypothetical protein A7P54_01890 [Acinetobacter sp. Ac_3412]|uniref:hypothetical protein n=1 Tax=Acinetobacter sp. Ac_3412 TaxID=1848935 RepID=UPI00148FD7C5|nr:hypothetical protein [Acinetobacter sp. Ac_3412]NNP75167.1 hypothetical protein [Acinetobacter sp. Ac_3412]